MRIARLRAVSRIWMRASRTSSASPRSAASSLMLIGTAGCRTMAAVLPSCTSSGPRTSGSLMGVLPFAAWHDLQAFVRDETHRPWEPVGDGFAFGAPGDGFGIALGPDHTSTVHEWCAARVVNG